MKKLEKEKELQELYKNWDMFVGTLETILTEKVFGKIRTTHNKILSLATEIEREEAENYKIPGEWEEVIREIERIRDCEYKAQKNSYIKIMIKKIEKLPKFR